MAITSALCRKRSRMAVAAGTSPGNSKGSGVFDWADALSAAGTERRFQAESGGDSVLPCFLAVGPAAFDASADRFHLGRCLGAVDIRVPVARRLDRPAVQRQEPRRRRFAPALGQAAPRPAHSRFYQIRPFGVALDIPADGQKVLILLDREALESTLIKRAGARAMVM